MEASYLAISGYSSNGRTLVLGTIGCKFKSYYPENNKMIYRFAFFFPLDFFFEK